MEYDNIYMNRGDTLDFKFDVEGAEADLSSAFFSCKKDPNDDEYIFQKASPRNLIPGTFRDTIKSES